MTPGGPRFLGLSILPLLLGILFFAASLTPSLIPRTWIVQGALAGVVMAIGYLIGRLLLAGWRAIDLPLVTGRAARIGHWVVAVPVLAVWAFALARAAHWQDTIRSRVAMEATEAYHTVATTAVAVVVFAVLFAIGWAVQKLFDLLRFRLYRVMRPRTANALGLVLAVVIIGFVTRDWILRGALDAIDESYEAAQALFTSAPPAPTDTRFAGGPGSLVDWAAMGQPGRNFIQGGPDAAAISAFTGRAAKDPIRVYVGRAQDDDPVVRAEIALEELRRLGAFDRRVLIVASPTGTGWMDPGGHDPVGYMHDGDVATVAVQYSYLQSPLALIFETRSGLDQATATMNTVYRYWRSLPPDERPAFYVHGISLGAWSSMYAFDVFRILNDPIQGALWTGPPFPSGLWQQATSAREPASPYVLPVVGNGSLVRFMSQFGGLERATADWGRLRIVFMQHASDPITFYDPLSFWRSPQWMREPPAPDVSPANRFVPIVTQFQLAFDMAISKAVPPGYGHTYVADEYIDAWVAVTAPQDWSEEDTTRLKDWCSLDWGLGCRN